MHSTYSVDERDQSTSFAGNQVIEYVLRHEDVVHFNYQMANINNSK